MYHWYNQFISLFDLCMNTRETVSTCINSTHILDICEACWTHQPYPGAQNPHVVICWICQFGLRLQKSPPQWLSDQAQLSWKWDVGQTIFGIFLILSVENQASVAFSLAAPLEPIATPSQCGTFSQVGCMAAIWFGRCQLIEGSKKVMGTSGLFLLIPSYNFPPISIHISYRIVITLQSWNVAGKPPYLEMLFSFRKPPFLARDSGLSNRDGNQNSA